MKLNLLDFLIGLLLMNAMPHMIFGLIRLRFFKSFWILFAGKSPVCPAQPAHWPGGVYHYQYDIRSLQQDGIMLGALAVLLLYLITGRFLAGFFQPKYDPILPDYFKDE